jgi:hypothetical protein
MQPSRRLWPSQTCLIHRKSSRLCHKPEPPVNQPMDLVAPAHGANQHGAFRKMAPSSTTVREITSARVLARNHYTPRHLLQSPRHSHVRTLSLTAVRYQFSRRDTPHPMFLIHPTGRVLSNTSQSSACARALCNRLEAAVSRSDDPANWQGILDFGLEALRCPARCGKRHNLTSTILKRIRGAPDSHDSGQPPRSGGWAKS